MDTTMIIYDMAKRRLRASSIVGEEFRPHAYIPLDINIEKVKAAIKELGLEEMVPDIPDEIQDIRALAMVGLNPRHMDDSLETVGQILSQADVSSCSVVCDMTVDDEGEEMEVLCIANIDLKASDSMMMLPYAREPEDVAFGEVTTVGAVTESLRDKVIEGFLNQEAMKFVHDNPDGDTDEYVDNLPSVFPNVEGALNTED